MHRIAVRRQDTHAWGDGRFIVGIMAVVKVVVVVVTAVGDDVRRADAWRGRPSRRGGGDVPPHLVRIVIAERSLRGPPSRYEDRFVALPPPRRRRGRSGLVVLVDVDVHRRHDDECRAEQRRRGMHRRHDTIARFRQEQRRDREGKGARRRRGARGGVGGT